MPEDLRSALERVGSAMPVDGQAFDRTMRRARRRAITRRITAGTLAVAVMIGGGALVWQLRPEGARSDRPGKAVAASPTVGAQAPPGWQTCEKRELGYSLAYPGGWLAPEQGTWPDGRIERVPEMACHFFDPKPFSVRLSEASDPADRDGIDHRADRVVAVHVTPDPDDSFEADVRRIRGGVRWTILDEDALTIGGRGAVRFVYRERATWDLYIVDLGERGSLALSVARQAPDDPGVATRYPQVSAAARTMLETLTVR